MHCGLTASDSARSGLWSVVGDSGLYHSFVLINIDGKTMVKRSHQQQLVPVDRCDFYTSGPTIAVVCPLNFSAF